MIGERFKLRRPKEKLTGFQSMALGFGLLHFLIWLASMGLSDPKAGIYSPQLHLEIVRRVLDFPMMTLRELIFGPLDHAEREARFFIRFWVGSNSALWGCGLAFIARAALRRLQSRRERIWSQG